MEDRVCIFCDKAVVEEEIHFIIEYEYYSDLRYKLMRSAAHMNPQFAHYCSKLKYQYILQQKKCQLDLAKLCLDSYHGGRIHAPTSCDSARNKDSRTLCEV